VQRIATWLSFVMLLSAVFGTTLNAQTTIKAASCNKGDLVKAIHQSAANGDIVSIPAGTCIWTSPLSTTLSKSIVIRGAGAEIPSMSCTFAPGVACTKTAGTDNTTIVDGSRATSELWGITTGSASTSFRLTGIAFQSGKIENSGMVFVGGNSRNVRIDHCHFIATSSFAGRSIWFGGAVYGVTDHNVFTNENSDQNEIHFGNGNDGGTLQGDGSWAAPTSFGGSTFMYVENNILDDTAVTNTHNAVDDCDTGGKGVLRFNSVLNGDFLGHPTGHAGEDRGCRALEIYGNTLKGNDTAGRYLYDVLFWASGTSLVWGNWSSAGYENYIILIAARTSPRTMGYTQAPPPMGWGYCGTANGPSPWDGNTDSTGYPCLDYPGRGQGDLLSGLFPQVRDTKTGKATWPRQALEPIYEWLNSWSPLAGFANTTFSNEGVMTQDRDYYAYTTSFNGTSGVGAGTLANRPATCTKGVGYWATDQGNWNQNGSGRQGKLFVCIAANRWTLYYTPYTYPHPLDTKPQATS
jgi:hypothetical protein